MIPIIKTIKLKYDTWSRLSKLRKPDIFNGKIRTFDDEVNYLLDRLEHEKILEKQLIRELEEIKKIKLR